jgi:hypothetical protein
MKERKHEVLRSDVMSFQRDLRDFLTSNHKEHWRVGKCTFFRDNDNTKAWASCSFER